MTNWLPLWMTVAPPPWIKTCWVWNEQQQPNQLKDDSVVYYFISHRNDFYWGKREKLINQIDWSLGITPRPHECSARLHTKDNPIKLWSVPFWWAEQSLNAPPCASFNLSNLQTFPVQSDECYGQILTYIGKCCARNLILLEMFKNGIGFFKCHITNFTDPGIKLNL